MIPENVASSRDGRTGPTPENTALLEQYAAHLARSSPMSSTMDIEPESARNA
jgi:hypothetical protein